MKKKNILIKLEHRKVALRFLIIYTYFFVSNHLYELQGFNRKNIYILITYKVALAFLII